MSGPAHPDTRAILARFGLGEADRLGFGGESEVYAIDTKRVLRIPRTSPPPGAAVRQKRLLDAIAGRLPFATPAILEIGDTGYTVEARLPGRVMTERLPRLGRRARTTAFGNYFAAATAIAKITFDDLPYGTLLADPPLVAPAWPAFMEQSMARYGARNRRHIGALHNPDDLAARAMALIADVPPAPPHALVHGDFFPGNVLMDDDLTVTAVIDFSPFTVVGDPLLELAGAVIFPEMLEDCTADDQALLSSLAVARCGAQAAPAFRAYRAYFALAMAAPPGPGEPYPGLYPWAVRTMKALAEGRIEAFAEPDAGSGSTPA